MMTYVRIGLLLFILIGVPVIIMWIIIIKDILKGLGYLKSQKVTNKGKDNQDNHNSNKPEPSDMSMIKAHDCQNNLINTCNDEQKNNEYKSSYRSPLAISHKGIINDNSKSNNPD